MCLPFGIMPLYSMVHDVDKHKSLELSVDSILYGMDYGARYRVPSIGGWCFASECISWQGSDERDSFLAW